MVNKFLCWFLGHRLMYLPTPPALFFDSSILKAEGAANLESGAENDVNIALLPPHHTLRDAFYEVAVQPRGVCERCGTGISHYEESVK